MTKSNTYDEKRVVSQDVSSFRKQDGRVVFRKEKVFFDGSRLVEEHFLDGDDDDIECGGNHVPIVNANYVGQQTQDESQEMLQPIYDPDGNPYMVALLMFCKYGVPIITFIVIWVLRAKKTIDTVQCVAGSNNDDGCYYDIVSSYSDDNYYSNNGWGY
jgi:hypothetical protein